MVELGDRSEVQSPHPCSLHSKTQCSVEMGALANRGADSVLNDHYYILAQRLLLRMQTSASTSHGSFPCPG